MFGVMSNPAAAYSKAGIETQVETASPHKLVLMLFDGALAAVSTALIHLRKQETARKCEAIARAIEIIDTGLRSSLDYQAGGEIAERLGALYEYMCNRLAYANLKNDAAVLDEVSRLLLELKGAWEEIASDPAVVSQNKVAA